MPSDSKLLADRLNGILEERDITANRLATMAEIPQSSISAIINGASASPKIGTLVKLAHGLDMSLTELLDFPPYNQRPDGTSAAKQRDKWEQLGDVLTADERDRVRRVLLDGNQED